MLGLLSMRTTRTNSEIAAISSVSFTLTSSGAVIKTEDSITDKPDWVFQLDDIRIGAECTCINLEKLMKWNGSQKQLVPEKFYEITFPNEPHFWIKRAIEDKNSKIPDYIKRSSAHEVWLITHAEFGSGLALYECDASMIKLMKQAAAAVSSDFDRIWFVHPETGCHELWRKGDQTIAFPELAIAGSLYPTCTIKHAIGTFTKKGLTISAGPENTIEKILLQPLDTRYRL